MEAPDNGTTAAAAAAAAAASVDADSDAAFLAVLDALEQQQPVETIRSIVEDGGPHVLTARDEEGWTVLHYAAESKASGEVMKYLVDACPQQALMGGSKTIRGGGDTVLVVALENDAPFGVVRLVTDAWEAALETKAAGGCTPLHAACAHGASLDVVSFLALRRPLSLVERNGIGCLPLHHAVENSNTEPDVVRFLVAHAPSALSERDGEGRLPIDIAASVAAAASQNPDRLEIVQCLAGSAV
jgi:ankyrin repeat protein